MKQLTAGISHVTVFNTDKVVEFFKHKDGVPFIYVCTTTLNGGIHPADVFYRQTPHPKFGNRYLGLLMNENDQTYVCNADCVEQYVFGLVKDEYGALNYSSHRHDFRMFSNGNMIDGGRDYIRSAGGVEYGIIRDGQFYQHEEENELQY